MRNLSKITSSLILSIALLVAPNLASAALTVGSTSVVSDGALTLNGAVGSNVLFGTTATTGSISMGTALTTGNYTVGGTSQTGTITIGQSTQNNYVKIGSGIPASSKVTVVEIAKSDGVSGSNYLVEIANGYGSASGQNRTVNIATGGNASVNIGNTQTASTVDIQAGATGHIWLNPSSSAYLWLGGFVQTGEIKLGFSDDTNTISIGNANTATGKTQTINIGAGTPAGTGKALITIGNTSGASSLILSAGTGNILLQGAVTTTYTLGTTTGTGAITIGRSSASNTINIGSGILNAAATQLIYITSPTIGTATSTTYTLIGSPLSDDSNQIIVIGSPDSGSTGVTNLFLGNSREATSNITLGGHLRVTDNNVTTFRITTASIAGAGTTGKAVGSNSTDTTGNLTTGSEAHTTVVVTFKKTYGVAPQCIVNAANAAAAAVTGLYVTSTTSDFTINTASSTTNDKWNWLCLESTNANYSD